MTKEHQRDRLLLLLLAATMPRTRLHATYTTLLTAAVVVALVSQHAISHHIALACLKITAYTHTRFQPPAVVTSTSKNQNASSTHVRTAAHASIAADTAVTAVRDPIAYILGVQPTHQHSCCCSDASTLGTDTKCSAAVSTALLKLVL
eukprot:14246-Heterococcus_DN1.PRE.8